MSPFMKNVQVEQSHYDTCYGQCGIGRIIMTLVMGKVALGESL